MKCTHPLIVSYTVWHKSPVYSTCYFCGQVRRRNAAPPLIHNGKKPRR